MTEEEMDVTLIQQQQALSGFIRFDLQYLFRLQMSNLANQWQQAVRSSPVVASSSVIQHVTSSQLNSDANENSTE